MAESRNKRVLIVDNNEEESGRLGVMLQRAGFDSIATWSGLEALELLKSGEYDILLVSSYLPDVYVGDFFERVNRIAGPAVLDRHAGGLHSCGHSAGSEERGRRGQVSGK